MIDRIDYSFLTEEKVISDTDFQEKFDELLERTKNQENRITELMKEIKRKDIECADYEKAMEELKLGAFIFMLSLTTF